MCESTHVSYFSTLEIQKDWATRFHHFCVSKKLHPQGGNIKHRIIPPNPSNCCPSKQVRWHVIQLIHVAIRHDYTWDLQKQTWDECPTPHPPLKHRRKKPHPKTIPEEKDHIAQITLKRGCLLWVVVPLLLSYSLGSCDHVMFQVNYAALKNCRFFFRRKPAVFLGVKITEKISRPPNVFVFPFFKLGSLGIQSQLVRAGNLGRSESYPKTSPKTPPGEFLGHSKISKAPKSGETPTMSEIL